jgi:uroporphyrinogen decarboxylase
MRALALKTGQDRVPVISMASAYTAVLYGISLKEFYLQPEKALAAQLWALDLHQYDGGPAFNIPHWAGWDFGGELIFPSSPKVAMPVLKQRAVEKPEDVEKLVLPDPDTAPAASRILQFARLARNKGFSVSIYNGSPMGIAGSIMDSNLLMRLFYKQPALVHRVLRLATDYLLLMADRFINEFGVENCSAFSTFPFECHAMISPQIFNDFSLPYIKEIHSNLLAKGIKRWLIHLCGDHTRNLKHWQKDIPLAPRTVFSIGHEMDIVKTAEFLGPDHIIAGNISTDLLNRGTPDEVLTACREQINVMKHQPGGYILAPACAMPPLTPPVNVHAMVKAARLYGQFAESVK